MAVIVAMLRAVNLAGHRRIKMDALRAVCESLGLKGAQTCLQSGNVVFRSDARDLVKLSKKIEGAIEREFGFRSEVILRTTAEMREVIARNPFAGRPEIHPGKLLVTFLARDPAREQVRNIKTNGEELRLDGRELYIYFPNGAGRSKVSAAAIERALKTPGTARNWNTVRKLLAMAEKLEVSPPGP